MNNLIKNLSLTTLICFVTTACSQNKTTTAITPVPCPNQPTIVLESNNVKPIDFSTQSITQSGMVSSNKSLGYTFEAKSGQKLSYTTNQDICIWIYTPDNQIITSRDLPTTGKYTIQVSVPKGSTTFDLVLNLENVTAASTPISSLSNNVWTTSTAATTSSPSPTSPVPNNNVWTNATVASNSISSPTPTSSTSNNVYRPSPAKVITAYYSKVNNHEYRDAWNILPTALQKDKELHKNGYNSFIEWWHKVKYVSINRYSLAEADKESAVVNVWTDYHMNNGRKVAIPLKFYMSWNDTSQKWDITKIKKN
jgi:hypothetical protein